MRPDLCQHVWALVSRQEAGRSAVALANAPERTLKIHAQARACEEIYEHFGEA